MCYLYRTGFQSSQESGKSSLSLQPLDQAYVEALGKPPTAEYVSDDNCAKYVALVHHLLTAYMTATKLHSAKLVPEHDKNCSPDKQTPTMDERNTSDTHKDDTEVLRELKSHIKGFQSHLTRISHGPSTEAGAKYTQSLSLMLVLANCV